MTNNGVNMENAIRVAMVVLTAVGAALGVQFSPAGNAASQTQVAEAVRAELVPLASKVDAIQAAQVSQGARLATVEAKLAVVATPTAATTAAP